jgi:hypothetical protein
MKKVDPITKPKAADEYVETGEYAANYWRFGAEHETRASIEIDDGEDVEIRVAFEPRADGFTECIEVHMTPRQARTLAYEFLQSANRIDE